MWVIAFFSVLLVAIIIYAWLVKKYTSHDKTLDTKDTPKEADNHR